MLAERDSSYRAKGELAPVRHRLSNVAALRVTNSTQFSKRKKIKKNKERKENSV